MIFAEAELLSLEKQTVSAMVLNLQMVLGKIVFLKRLRVNIVQTTLYLQERLVLLISITCLSLALVMST